MDGLPLTGHFKKPKNSDSWQNTSPKYHEFTDRGEIVVLCYDNNSWKKIYDLHGRSQFAKVAILSFIFLNYIAIIFTPFSALKNLYLVC